MDYHDGMVRTTISLDEALRKKLKVMAAERGISMAELIRQLLAECTEPARPRMRSIGLGASGHRDTARDHDELLEPTAWRSS